MVFIFIKGLSLFLLKICKSILRSEAAFKIEEKASLEVCSAMLRIGHKLLIQIFLVLFEKWPFSSILKQPSLLNQKLKQKYYFFLWFVSFVYHEVFVK